MHQPLFSFTFYMYILRGSEELLKYNSRICVEKHQKSRTSCLFKVYNLVRAFWFCWAMEQVMMIFVSLVFFELVVSAICGNTLAPALYLFGDSSIDNGNNNLLPTLARANFFPYGIDFPRGSTGRFTDGKTIADFIGIIILSISFYFYL